MTDDDIARLRALHVEATAFVFGHDAEARRALARDRIVGALPGLLDRIAVLTGHRARLRVSVSART